MKIGERVNLTGKRFTRLIVIKMMPPIKGKSSSFWCKCDCGNEREAWGNSLRQGITKSCGCLQAEIRFTHGMANTKFYRVWRQIKIRCNPKHSKRYPLYAGRGIRVCKRWNKFENFFDDMFPTYKEGLTIDRKNNNGHYTPRNCRWVTPAVNSRNMRSSKFLTIKGITKNVCDWAKDNNIHVATFQSRLKAKLPKKLLLLPALPKGKRWNSITFKI